MCNTFVRKDTRVGGKDMKTYTITRTITDIVSVKAKDDKELMELYNEGAIDEMLTIEGNRTERYSFRKTK